jgi:hypothetical protein
MFELLRPKTLAPSWKSPGQWRMLVPRMFTVGFIEIHDVHVH